LAGGSFAGTTHQPDGRGASVDERNKLTSPFPAPVESGERHCCTALRPVAAVAVFRRRSHLPEQTLCQEWRIYNLRDFNSLVFV